MIVVPDASVILRWVLPRNISPFQEQALSIRDAAVENDLSMFVPPLWRYEVGNTLTRLLPEDAFMLLGNCEAVGLVEKPPSTQWQKVAIELASQGNVSFYDAAYHALAIVHAAVLVTADEKYVRNATQTESIRLLKDWQ